MTVAKDGQSGKRYRSPLRAEQARRTRAAVLDAAAACFIEAGYAATTMKDVAARAGVSVETVYGLGGKASLLLAAVDRTLAGDDEPVPLIERPALREVLAAPDAREAFHRLRDLTRVGLPPALPMLHAFQSAAGADPEIAAAYAVYGERRLADVRVIADVLAPGLRPGVTVDEAADVLWDVLDPARAWMLAVERGWGVPRWTDWVFAAMEHMLLG
jgi:AcrR family transcriptional regulator